MPKHTSPHVNPQQARERLAWHVDLRRMALGSSQQDLSARSAHFWTYVGNLERQKNRPTLGDVEAIAAALSVAVAELLRPVSNVEFKRGLKKLVRKRQTHE